MPTLLRISFVFIRVIFIDAHPASLHLFTVMKSFTSIAVFFISLSHTYALDVDADGMSDVFESLYGVTNPVLDPDGDGKTNLAESLAGTHPLQSFSYFKATYAAGTLPGDYQLAWPSVIGKNYAFRISNDLTSWLTSPNDPTAGTGALLTIQSNYAIPGSNKSFYQVMTTPSDDLDSDGLDAWEELTLSTSDFLFGDDEDLIPSVLEVVNGTNPSSNTSPASNSTYLALGNEADSFEIFTPGN